MPKEREKIGVEADGPQEKVCLKIFHPKEECDVWLPRAQGSVIADVCQDVERRSAVWSQTETEECIDQTAGTRSADYLRFLAEAEMRAADPDEYLDMDDSDPDDFEVIPGRNAAVLTCARVHLEDNSMSSSAKRACEIPPPVSRDPDTARH